MYARRAETGDVGEICRICSEGWRDTYAALRTAAEIEATIATFYTPERVSSEISEHGIEWGGWWVAEDDSGAILAAGGGGLTAPTVGELFVLYADPTKRYRGAGSAVLQAITDQQVAQGAREQWVSVGRRNTRGIPFYEARGFTLEGERPAHQLDGTSLRYRRTLPPAN